MKAITLIMLNSILISCSQQQSNDNPNNLEPKITDYQNSHNTNVLDWYDDNGKTTFPSNDAEFIATFEGKPVIKKQNATLPDGGNLEILRAELSVESDTTVYVAEFIQGERAWLDIYFEDEAFLRKMVIENGNQYGYENFIYEIDNSRKNERIIKVEGNYTKRITISETETVNMRWEIVYYFGDSSLMQVGYGVLTKNFPYGPGDKFTNSVKRNKKI
jgi:hypothetical protein